MSADLVSVFRDGLATTSRERLIRYRALFQMLADNPLNWEAMRDDWPFLRELLGAPDEQLERLLSSLIEAVDGLLESGDG